MMYWNSWILWPIVSYFVGNLSIGPLFGKKDNIDLSKVGSGNTGATNVGRVFGWKAALGTFLFDVAKAAVVCGTAQYYTQNLSYMAFLGMCVVIGHCLPVQRGFRFTFKGKGASSALGMVLVCQPIVGLYSFF